MPPSRIHGRYSIGRRPSTFTSPTSNLIKPGIYGASPSPRSVTFAPNVTPGTYQDSDEIPLDSPEEPALPPDAQLFPPSEQPSNPPSKRRAPPGKRRSQGYIPRPPNAFMLFRADFVRQKHVPGSIETNHGSLSKIIGNCWRALPLDEKRIWEIKAKQEKEAHSKRYPGYRFRPVHNKNKDKKKDKALSSPEDERRCEEVAQLLLEGMKGDELAAAIRQLDGQKVVPVAPQPQHHHQHFYPPRRPSSVPLPDARFHPISLPSVPFFHHSSRSASPVNNISRSARMIIGQRRPSSALPHFGRTSWGVDDIPMFPPVPVPDFYPPQALQRDISPLPDVDTSLFEETFNFGFPAGSGEPAATTFNDMFSDLPPHAASESPAPFNFTGMDHISPQDLSLTLDCMAASQLDLESSNVLVGDVNAWTNTPTEFSTSGSSSTYSGSPASSDLGLPVVAPRPQHVPAGLTLDMWQEIPPSCHSDGKVTSDQFQGLSVGLMTQPMSVAVAGMDVGTNHQIHIQGFDTLFDGAFTGMQF